MSQYSRAAKETGHSFEFEPRSISKDFRASTRIKPNKKKREREHKSSISLDERPETELVSDSCVCTVMNVAACVVYIRSYYCCTVFQCCEIVFVTLFTYSFL